MDADKAAGRCEGMKAKNDIVKSIVVLFVICLVVSAALAVVNSFTAPVSAVFRREIPLGADALAPGSST